jgi:hypothetical protein
MLVIMNISNTDREGAMRGVSSEPISSNALHLPYRFYLPLNSQAAVQLVSSFQTSFPLPSPLHLLLQRIVGVYPPHEAISR